MLLTEMINRKMKEDSTKVDEIKCLGLYRLGANYEFEKEELEDGTFRTLKKDNPLKDTLINVATQKEMGVTMTGYQQLSSQLGIPFNYLMKCNPVLRQQNVNAFLIQQKNERLLRLQQDKLRAVLSPRYAIVNDSSVLRVVDHFMQGGDIQEPILGSVIDDDNMFRIQILDKKKEVIEGTFAGLMIRNSETGYSSLEVGLTVYTKVCSNGLIAPRLSGDGYRRKHIGNVDFNRFTDYLGGNIKSLTDNFSSYQRMFENANKKILDRDKYIKYVETLKEFPEEWREGIKARALDSATQWKFASDWTELAQSFPSLTRMKIEEEAGKFLVKEF